MSEYPINSSARVYYDIEGNERTLHQMVKHEPEWAEARIREGEKAEARVLELLMERNALAAPNRDMVAHMHRQIAFSTRAFGPDERQAGVIDHIRKELREIEEAPHDLEEWVDVVLLALDGAWRSGHCAEEVVAMLDAKLTKNESREWPDWRTADRTKAIEHDRQAEGGE